MTIRRPEFSIFDRFLYRIGKNRGVLIPGNTERKYGKYASATVIKESFLNAFLRPNSADLPGSMTDLLAYCKKQKEKS